MSTKSWRMLSSRGFRFYLNSSPVPPLFLPLLLPPSSSLSVLLDVQPRGSEDSQDGADEIDLRFYEVGQARVREEGGGGALLLEGEQEDGIKAQEACLSHIHVAGFT